MTRFALGPLWWFAVTGCVVGLAIVATGPVRLGGYVLAATFAVAGLGRLALPQRLVGALVVRSRGLDAMLLLLLAAGLAVIFAVVKLTPLLQ